MKKKTTRTYDIPLNGTQKSGGRPYKSVAALRLSKLQRKRSTFASRNDVTIDVRITGEAQEDNETL